MRILILGYSNIVKRRVIPALLNIAQVSRIDIASGSSASQVALPDSIRGEVYDNYDLALSMSSADIVYISTLNTCHAQLAEKALLKGFHVIVDKPAVMSHAEAERLASLARRQNRCLAESTVYAYHPQIATIQDLFASAKTKPTRITAIFSFPPRPEKDYRYRKDLGGGALLDVGTYAMTPGRLFFNDVPKEIYCKIIDEKDGVDISFSLLAIYAGGRSMVGHFGFNTEYWNYLNVFGPDLSVDCERIFSITSDLENELFVKQKNSRRVVKSPMADYFVVFFKKLFDDINNGIHDKYLADLLSDAAVLQKLREAAGEKIGGAYK